MFEVLDVGRMLLEIPVSSKSVLVFLAVKTEVEQPGIDKLIMKHFDHG